MTLLKKLQSKFVVRVKPTFRDVDNYVLELLEKGTDSQKRKLYDILMADLFKSVSFSELEQSFKSLSSAERELMIEEAVWLKKSRLHNWLSQTIVRLIQQKLYIECKNDFDIAINKVGLWMEKNRERMLDDIALYAEQKEQVMKKLKRTK